MPEFKIICGDALEELRKLPSESVQMCCTSPPYWGLRYYGTGKWIGGDSSCGHKIHNSHQKPGRNSIVIGASVSIDGANRNENFRTSCICGATRIDSQIGLETTPEEYVERLVDAFGEVKRVLRKDGLLFCNLGDSYAGGGNYRGIHSLDSLSAKQRSNRGAQGTSQELGRRVPIGMKPKDLVGIPWMVAFALRADGWYLRSDIIWVKPNPMPESVTDRCTKSHEYIFMLSKRDKYFYDADAIAEPCKYPGGSWGATKKLDDPNYRSFYGEGRRWAGGPTRNRRTAWGVPTEPFKGAHFATMPIALIEPCILAGCPPDGTIIDPFVGSGSVGVAALRHGRNFIGIDLNPEYCEMAVDRITGDAPLFNTDLSELPELEDADTPDWMKGVAV